MNAHSSSNPKLIKNPGKIYFSKNRKWQGIPGIEIAPNGRLWATWYSGGDKEPAKDNYVLLETRDDDGYEWSKPIIVIDPENQVRAFDPCLWHDPQDRLWFFWNECTDGYDGRGGVWAITTSDSNIKNPEWSDPKRLCDGIMLNKPIVTSEGEWLLASAIWGREPRLEEFEKINRPNVYTSSDQGKNWELKGGAEVSQGRSKIADEHMLIEKKDGILWMLVRTDYGIGESFSYDKGNTWIEVKDSEIEGPDSRFFIRRLKSGNLLLVNHYKFTGRSHLTALLSNDEGKNWDDYLLLDEREQVSYPDGIQHDNGYIYIVHDRDRYGAGEILMSKFTEEDIRNGEIVSPQGRLKCCICRLN